MAPINTLPAEIMSSIFAEVPSGVESKYRRNSYCKKTGMLRAVTHVCRRWRSIALGNPSLWTSIYHLNGSDAARDSISNALQTYLQRSKEAPLHIYSDCLAGTPYFLQNIFASHGSRVRTLVVVVSGQAAREAWLQNSLNLPAPQLRRLALIDNRNPSSNATPLSLANTPALQSLTLCGSALLRSLPSSPVNNLIHLELSHAFQCEWTSTGVLMILSCCPRLEELILAEFDAVGHSVTGQNAISCVTLPRLVRLVLASLSPSFASDLLSHLRLCAAPIAISLRAITNERFHYSRGMDHAALQVLHACVDVVASKARPLKTLILRIDSRTASFLERTQAPEGRDQWASNISIDSSLLASPGDWLSPIRTSTLPELCNHVRTLMVSDCSRHPDAGNPDYAHTHSFAQSLRDTLIVIMLHAMPLTAMQNWLQLIGAGPVVFSRLKSLKIFACHIRGETAVPAALIPTLIEAVKTHAINAGRPLAELHIIHRPLENWAALEVLEPTYCELVTCESIGVLSSTPRFSWYTAVSTDSTYWPSVWCQ